MKHRRRTSRLSTLTTLVVLFMVFIVPESGSTHSNAEALALFMQPEFQDDDSPPRGPTQVQSLIGDKTVPLASGSATLILHTQMDYLGNWGVVSQNYEWPYDSLDTESADDFTVPSADGTWAVESIDILGFCRGSSGNTFDCGSLSSANVRIYANAGNVPGLEMYEAQLLATTSGSLVSSDTRLYTIDLDVPAVLPSGTYWISVQVNMDFVAGDFMWRERVVQNGNPFAFRNPGGGWGEGCTSWCGGHGIEPDLIFQLNGTKGNPMVTVLSTGSVKDVVLHKTQSLLFASDASANGVLVVDTSSDSIVNSIPVGSQPWGLAMSPDSSKAYVALSGGSALKVINTDSQSVTGMFTLSFSPKNAEYGGPGLLYITENSSTFTPIHIIDPLDGSEDATFGSFYRGGEIAISPDGNTLCVGESGLSPASVDCYDISAATPSFLIGNSNVGSNLQTIDISSDGSLVYLACGSPYHLQARYLSTLNVAGQYDTGAYPESALDSADGEFLFGSGGDSSWVWNADAYQKFRILDHKEVVFLAAGFDNRTAFASNDSLAIYHFTSFVDLAWNHWARSFIESIFEAGVTSGFPDGTYRPNNNVTRAEMAVFLKKGIHGGSYVPPTPDGSHPFSDIAGHWAEAWMEDLYDEGLTSGYPDGTYRPQNQVTRAEMAVFLLKAKYGSSYTPPPVSGGSFTDVAGHWAEAWIEQLAEEGITSGYPDGTYRPNNNVTRAEMAVFLVRTFNLPMP